MTNKFIIYVGPARNADDPIGSIRIGDLEYDVCPVSQARMDAVSGETGNVGYYDTNLLKIWYVPQANESRNVNTVVHEIMHCIAHQIGADWDETTINFLVSLVIPALTDLARLA